MTQADEAIQGDLFLCDGASWPVKDDMASMSVPIFSLRKQRDTRIRTYRRGNTTVKIIPSAAGAATVFDKDLLLYISTQLTQAKNSGQAISRTVKINTIDFLNATERGDGRVSFESIPDMLHRLRGTTIETNIPTGDKTQTDGFSLIDSYQIVSSKKRRIRQLTAEGKSAVVEIERPLCFAVTVSEWLLNAIAHFEVLTLDQDYFKLGKPIERRFYELARKHCGDQAYWVIGIDALAEKLGQADEIWRLRGDVRDSIVAKRIPGYYIALDTHTNPHQVVFYTRNSAKLTTELLRKQRLDWYSALERHDNTKNWQKQRLTKKPEIEAV